MTEKKFFHFDLEISKSGLPCLWESGGGFTNTGRAQIICDPNGRPKKAIYIRRRGELACREHALIPVCPGDFVVRAYQHRGDFAISLWRLDQRYKWDGGERFLGVQLAVFDDGEWDHPEIAEEFQAAITAVKEKARCYHCREPHFVAE